MKIEEIKEMLEQTEEACLPVKLEEFRKDERSGVRKLIERFERKYTAYKKEQERLLSMLSYENTYDEAEHICGIDEAGRGPLAGPVAAAAVILPKGLIIPYLNDSKQLSEKRREALYEEIMETAYVGVGIVEAARIDEINILQATYEAMRKAIQKLPVLPDILLNDAVTIPDVPVRQVPIIKGDAKSLSIAAASVIAKVTRDRMMKLYDEIYPEYGFSIHKGYGTQAHIGAIRTYGPSPIHRRSFIKNFVRENE